MLRIPRRGFSSNLAEHVKVSFSKSQTFRPLHHLRRPQLYPLTPSVSIPKPFLIRRPMTTTPAAAVAGLSAEPAQGQTIEHDGKRYTTIREGLAYILVPEAAGDESGDGASKNPDRAATSGEGAPQTVFYNPIQQFNRDLSVLAIKAYGKVVMEKRMRLAQRRMEMFADKKRKRQEKREHREEGERPQKVAKTTDEGAAAPVEAADANSTAVAEEAGASVTEQEAQAESAAPAHVTQDKISETPVKLPNDKTPRLKILDALSATGLRALRYAHELPFPTMVTSNDLLAAAVDSIKVNVKHNKLEDSIRVNHGNAQGHMYSVHADELTRSMLAPSGNKHRRQTPQEQLNNLGGKYDVIDLDPYGTAATFFDSAVQAVRDDGGLLCVTCTDPGVWASNGYPEKAYALYGGIPMKGFHCHEAGVRLILHGLASSAARYGLAIEPLLSLSIDYYARVFVRVTKSPAAVKFQAGKTMVVYNCDVGCGAWETQLLLRNRPMPNKKGGGIFYKHGFALGPTTDKVCGHCGTKTHLAGPMYAGRLHSPEFIQSILDDLPNASTEVYGTTDRIKGMLTTALEEIMDPRPEDREAIPKKHIRHEQEVAEANKCQQDEKTNGEKSEKSKKQESNGPVTAPKLSKEERLAEIEPYPFFWSPSMVAKVLHCQTPNEDAIRGALKGLGYRVTRSHCKPGSVKTDAPWSVVWEVMREWVRQKSPIHEGSLKEGSPGWHIMHGLPSSAQVTADSGEKMEGVEGEQKQPEKKEDGQASKIEVVFDENLGRERNKEKLTRYPVHPENWGPRSRAVGE
ncbi:hypothetical protein MCOR27_001445 [Pyricularia oryzae]|uniref:tRNA (guanine(26)-N(2))-dimethyltransferase n=2 Tax=Pyricularia TaxID=48558 RepID=A0ABQ8NM87_PYRGI|nr:hypothetical protein MCOR01_010374 [Pyricularia oryzae]KAI6299269.1 hypothetical protein MCOR33_004798 [Pyricularia grisea]KAH9438656.1 hypothetical protein MCOR02_002269 [Pyricularia oryzae]KAI6261591.1 hypothetical protein MCOR19_002162 [Pyricularia oryzae]KAI6264036.1 hypothetical protein MCOR34_011919 [Pyricularia oryzae]